jgi:outer membrane protein assembly factor BamA
VDALVTPVGILGGLRGVLFFNLGGAGFNNQNFRPFASNSENIPVFLGYVQDPITGLPVPVFSPPVPVSGFRLVDSQASYGLGLQTAVLGFPIHFDWAWKTRFNRDYEDILYYYAGSQTNQRGSDYFRKVKFQFWIGYDF